MKRAMKPETPAKAPLRPKHVRLLQIVGSLTLATTQQANNAWYSEGSVRPTSGLLFDLYNDWKYLEREHLRTSLRGEPLAVHRISKKGQRFLAKLGQEADYVRISDPQHLAHAVESNEPLVKALQLTKRDPSLMVEILSETSLRRQPIIHQQSIVIPDAWAHFVKDKGPGYPPGECAFAFEIDRATKNAPGALQDRLRDYIFVDQSNAATERLGTDLLVVVWAVREGGSKRLERIRRLAEKYLISAGLADLAEMFRFGQYGKDTSAEQFYYDERWYRPFADNPQSLLPVIWK